MQICRKIDVHAHVVLHREYEYPKGVVISPDELISVYDRIGVEKGILLPITSPEAQNTVLPNGGMCDLAHRRPDRFLWFCNVDPRALTNSPDSDLEDMLRFYMGNGAIGMGELTANLPVDDPRMEHLFECCEACSLPVTIHIGPQEGGCYGIVDGVGLYGLQRILKKHPSLKLLGHSQPFWAEIGADCDQGNRNTYPRGRIREGRLAELLRECPNLYCDMSAGSCYNALTRDEDYIWRFIEEFGDRMMYAIDVCSPLNTHTYRTAAWLDWAAQEGKISPERYTGICRENAIRILKIPEA